MSKGREWFYCRRDPDDISVVVYPGGSKPRLQRDIHYRDHAYYDFDYDNEGVIVCSYGFRKLFGFVPRKGYLYKVVMGGVVAEKVCSLEELITKRE